VAMPTKLSGSAPLTVMRVSSSLCLRIERRDSTASGRANGTNRSIEQPCRPPVMG
jgi:hypothetical protein